MRFLVLLKGVFSLYSSINPCCLSSLEIPFTVCPFFPLSRSAAFSYLHRKLLAFSRAPQLPAGLFCHRLPWLQPTGGELGRELGAGIGAPCGPATSLLSEHHFAWQEPEGTAALCLRAEGFPYAFTGVLIKTGVRR